MQNERLRRKAGPGAPECFLFPRALRTLRLYRAAIAVAMAAPVRQWQDLGRGARI